MNSCRKDINNMYKPQNLAYKSNKKQEYHNDIHGGYLKSKLRTNNFTPCGNGHWKQAGKDCEVCKND